MKTERSRKIYIVRGKSGLAQAFWYIIWFMFFFWNRSWFISNKRALFGNLIFIWIWWKTNLLLQLGHDKRLGRLRHGKRQLGHHNGHRHMGKRMERHMGNRLDQWGLLRLQQSKPMTTPTWKSREKKRKFSNKNNHHRSPHSDLHRSVHSDHNMHWHCDRSVSVGETFCWEVHCVRKTLIFSENMRCDHESMRMFNL